MPPRNYRNSSRRSRMPTLILGGLGLFALTAVGIIGTLWLAGVPLNPFADREPVEDPFMVRIPINATPIPAYARVDRSHLLNPNQGGLMYQKVPPQAAVGMSIVGVDQNGSHVESRVESIKNVDDEVVFVVTGGAEVRQGQTLSLGGAIMNINAIIGRVVKADKRAGLGFQESTFFPKGTPEGLAGATPQGMRAITLDATRLTGVHSLGAGDLIDLLASVPVGDTRAAVPATASEVELLAQNAKVLRPVYVRNEVTQSASLMNGASVSNVPKYEVAIAVAADDVIPLQNALNQELPITCVAHSMQPVQEDETALVNRSIDEVRVPVTVRPILAYQVVSRDAFVSSATRSIKTATISRREADRMDVIRSVTEALGALTRQDIPAGRYLRQSDLLKGPPAERKEADTSLEAAVHRTNTAGGMQLVSMLQTPEAARTAPSATAVGDRPAITTFIPAGRTAFAIPLNRIYGAEHLQIGDSIDLLASYSLERLRDEEETETRPDGTVIVRKSESLTPRTTQRSWEETFGNRAEPWFVASDAIVVAPVGFPAPAAALRAIQSGGNPQADRSDRMAGPAVIIAVSDQDVESFATAMATRESLFTVAFHAAASASPSPRRKTIAIAPESIAAYAALTENAWKGNRRSIATRTVATSDPRFADAITLEQLSSFYGRVLKNDKPRGEFFTAADFLPAGTAAGIAASARVGFTLLPIADREIEGLDAFESGDPVSILLRGVLRSPVTQRAAGGAGVATSIVVVPAVRIARASVAGQSILEIPNEHLTRLQAAIARSLTDRDDFEDRSHLVAVGIERRDDDVIVAGSDEIPSFDPLANVKTTQLIIGGRRSVEVYGGGGL
ncbi:hypothetical protein Enr13x_57450 [Stieleria neptunia]|uniref:Uncharacterized protein n=1 Tax=Stieleria neptunia TaxID=2527979 RepID=A0A518HYB5_9BACT|nr:hypothetical protein [Stieleria neptunia]QDV45842.1 hypothetical protein Enr13x_57450 [Stieleria neptunia]